jgi:hypothetical protein
LKPRAGNEATDCGTAALGMSAAAVDACVVKAFDSGTPFVARYARQGTDSKIVLGIVRDQQGTVTFLEWDSAPCGGPGCDPVITALTCDGPAVDDSPTRNSNTAPITCASALAVGRVCE